LHCNNF